MAANVAPGTIKKETTYTELVPAESSPEGSRKRKRPPLWEFLPTVPMEDWKNLRYEIRLYRYNATTEKRMAVEKIYECIDPFWVQKKYGGGSFNVLVSEDAQLIYNEDFYIEGEPRIAGAVASDSMPVNSAGNGGGVVEAMRMAMNPEFMRGMFEMFKMASMESMAMLKNNMPAPVDPLQTLRNAKEILGLGAPVASPMDDILKQLMAAMVQKLINPPETNAFKDTMALISEVKSAGFLGGAPKADLASTLVANLPMIADRVVSGLHEFRMQSEAQLQTVRLQRGEMRPSDPGVIEMPPVQDRQPNPTPPAAPTQGATLTKEQTQQIIMQADLTRLVQAMKDPGCTGEDIYSYLSHVWPEMLVEISKYSKDQLVMLFKSREAQMSMFGNSILYEVGNDPRLPKMIEELLAIAKAEDAKEPAPAVVV